MNCAIHSEALALDRCLGCAEPFCFNCLVDIGGRKYCSQCKVLSLEGRTPAIVPTKTCPEAKEALTFAYLGLVLFGFIFEPLAIVKAIKARKKIAQDPLLGGSGMANAAIVIAVIGCVLLVLNIVSRVS